MADSANIDRLLHTIDQNMKRELEAIQDLKRLFEYPDSMRSKVTRSAKQRSAELKNTKKATDALASMTDVIVDAKTNFKDYGKLTKKERNLLAKSTEKVINSSLELSEAHKKRLQTLARVIKSTKHVDVALNALSKTTEEVYEQQIKLHEKRAATLKYENLLGRKFLVLKDRVGETIKKFSSLSTTLSLMTVGATRSFGDIESALRNQVPLMNIMSSEFRHVAELYGLSQQEFAEVYKSSAQTILGATSSFTSLRSSTTQFIDAIGQSTDKLYELTGSREQAARLQGDLMKLLGKSGIQMSFNEMQQQINGPGGLADSLKFLARTSNLNAQEMVQLISTMDQDDAMRLELLGLSEKERKNRKRQLLEQQALLRETGMLAPQFVEFRKTLSRITETQDPKSLMKMIGRTIAVAGAMGFKNTDLNKVMQLMLKPKSKLTPEELKFLSQFATQMEERQAKMIESSNLGMRLTGMALRTELPAPAMEFIKSGSVATNKQYQLTKQQVDSIKRQTGIIDNGFNKVLESMKKGWEVVQKFLGSAEFSLAGGTLSAIGSIFKTAIEFVIARSLMKSAGLGLGDIFGFKGVGKGGIGKWFGRMFSSAKGIGRAILSNGGRTSLAGTLATTGGELTLGTMAGGAAVAGATGYAIGTAIDKTIAAVAPEFHRDMQDAIGGTIDVIVNKSIPDLISDTINYWGDTISGWFSDNDEEKKKTHEAIEKLVKEQQTANAIAEQNVKETQKVTSAVKENTKESKKSIEDSALEAAKRQRYYEIRMRRSPNGRL